MLSTFLACKKNYIYSSTHNSPENGVTVVGGWEMELQPFYYASWFADSAVRVTQRNNLAAGYAYAKSKCRPFVIDGEYWCDSTLDAVEMGGALTALSDSVVIFVNNGSINILPNSQARYALLEVFDVENVVFVDATFNGDKDQHFGTGGEWGHGINVYPCRNVRFLGKTTINNCWGDGIYFGVPYYKNSAKHDLPTDILIEDLRIDNVRRDAISLCGGRDLRINRSNLSRVSGTAPMAGVNIEPEEAGGRPLSNLYNVVLNDTTITDALYCIAINIGGNRHVDVTLTGKTELRSKSYASSPIAFSTQVFPTNVSADTLKQTGGVVIESMHVVDHPAATNKFYSICEVKLPRGGLPLRIRDLTLDCDTNAMFFGNDLDDSYGNQTGLTIENVSKWSQATAYLATINQKEYTFNHTINFGVDTVVSADTYFRSGGKARIGGYSKLQGRKVSSSSLVADMTLCTPVDAENAVACEVILDNVRRITLRMNPEISTYETGQGIWVSGGNLGSSAKVLKSISHLAFIDVQRHPSENYLVYGGYNLSTV